VSYSSTSGHLGRGAFFFAVFCSSLALLSHWFCIYRDCHLCRVMQSEVCRSYNNKGPCFKPFIPILTVTGNIGVVRMCRSWCAAAPGDMTPCESYKHILDTDPAQLDTGSPVKSSGRMYTF